MVPGPLDSLNSLAGTPVTMVAEINVSVQNQVEEWQAVVGWEARDRGSLDRPRVRRTCSPLAICEIPSLENSRSIADTRYG